MQRKAVPPDDRIRMQDRMIAPIDKEQSISQAFGSVLITMFDDDKSVPGGSAYA
jgi:hypothetical protein